MIHHSNWISHHQVSSSIATEATLTIVNIEQSFTTWVIKEEVGYAQIQALTMSFKTRGRRTIKKEE